MVLHSSNTRILSSDLFCSVPVQVEIEESVNFSVSTLNEIKQKFCKHAFIAGGAPRDWFFNIQPRDLDIFIPYQKPEYYLDFKEIFESLSFVSKYNRKEYLPLILSDPSSDTSVSNSTYKDNANIDAVFVVDSLMQSSFFEIQIIFLKEGFDTKEKAISNFPLSISRISLDQGVLSPSPSFMRGLLNATIYKSENCLPNYLDKIKSKFPEYKILDE